MVVHSFSDKVKEKKRRVRALGSFENSTESGGKGQ
jgi:hypothetical protein